MCANYKTFEDEAISKGVTFKRIVALMEAAERPGMNLANLGKTADRYVENHQNTENRQELSLLTATRDAIKAEGNSLGGSFLPERGRGGKGDYRGIRGRGCVFP